MDSALSLTEAEYKNTTGLVIDFGLSDPTRFREKKFCDFACTNDYTLSEKTGYYWYPTSCDKRYHRNLNLDKSIDVLFYGINRHPSVCRGNVLRDLRDSHGIYVEFYGPDWGLSTNLIGNDLIEKINKSKIVLDISTVDSSLPRRIFEASCCGTPVLTLNRPDTRLLFTEDQDILFYNHFEEIPEKLSQLLNKPDFIRDVGLNARNRCLKEHDISIRIDNLLRAVQGA
jgi:glycosyltransferase involved in cell wall biosynthesis